MHYDFIKPRKKARQQTEAGSSRNLSSSVEGAQAFDETALSLRVGERKMGPEGAVRKMALPIGPRVID